MNLVDYEKYYHSGSEFIISRDEFEKIIEENQRLKDINFKQEYELENRMMKIDYLECKVERLNNDIKVLLKENEAKEKVIIKQNNVLNELRENAIAFINIFQDEKTLTLNYNDLKHLRGIINGEEFDIRILKEKLNELKKSDK